MNTKSLKRLFVGIVFTTTTWSTALYAATDTSIVTSPSYLDEINIGVVNFSPVWGDKEANLESMINYINYAETKDVDLLLLPEMCLTGYASSSDPDSEIYKMPIALAESTEGPTAQKIAELADTYDMWIVYGGTEIIEGDSNHAYNSAFACSPDGEVTSYQKIHPVEGSWCVAGTVPTMIDTEWGPIGLSICYDTYATPELTRLYIANGSRIILNPTASSRSYNWKEGNSNGWEWYYKNRLESSAYRDKVIVASANLVGEDGPIKEDGNSTYHFPGGSVVVGPESEYIKYYAGDPGNSDEGLLVGSVNLSIADGATMQSDSAFNPLLYTKWYQELANKKADGEKLAYTSTVEISPKVAVAQCNSSWGNKETNISTMIDYIEEAAKQKVEIVVFPEMMLTGYSYIKPTDGNQSMQAQLAETVPGYSSNILAEYAKKYGMYIIYGLPENKGGKIYNSVAIISPEGTQSTYQKIHLTEDEMAWASSGDTPFILDTQWGKIGINVGEDAYYYSELGRYYAASGCTILIQLTATDFGNKTYPSTLSWYGLSQLGIYTDRDGMAVINCNMTGEEGPEGSLTKLGGGSLILTKNSTGVNQATGSPLNLNGTILGYSEPILYIADLDLSKTGFGINGFNPQVFATAYQALVKK